MTTAEKLTAVAENVQKVYEAGTKSEYDRFWDTYQQNGNRTNYEFAFAGHGWTREVFLPKYSIRPTSLYMFTYQANNTAPVDFVEMFDNRGLVFDTTNCTNWQYAFSSTKLIERLGRINACGKNLSYQTFYYNSTLHTIEALEVDENTTFSNNYTFAGASKLENLTITGTIGQNGFDVSWSPLTHDSLMSIINALKDYSTDTSGTTWVVTLGSNKNKLSDAEKTIATAKGWTIA